MGQRAEISCISIESIYMYSTYIHTYRIHIEYMYILYRYQVRGGHKWGSGLRSRASRLKVADTASILGLRRLLFRVFKV